MLCASGAGGFVKVPLASDSSPMKSIGMPGALKSSTPASILEEVRVEPGPSARDDVFVFVHDRGARLFLELLGAEKVELLRDFGFEKLRRETLVPLADVALEDVPVDELVDPARSRKQTHRRDHRIEDRLVDVRRVLLRDRLSCVPADQERRQLRGASDDADPVRDPRGHEQERRAIDPRTSISTTHVSSGNTSAGSFSVRAPSDGRGVVLDAQLDHMAILERNQDAPRPVKTTGTVFRIRLKSCASVQ